MSVESIVESDVPCVFVEYIVESDVSVFVESIVESDVSVCL